MSDSTTARGYGTRHQTIRKRMIAAFQPGQPCARCHRPINDKADAELDHDDSVAKQDGIYLGLSHKRCNRAAGGRKAHAGHASANRQGRRDTTIVVDGAGKHGFYDCNGEFNQVTAVW